MSASPDLTTPALQESPIRIGWSGHPMNDVTEDICDGCKYEETKAFERIAQQRAAARAHTLAMKEARSCEEKDTRFSFLELYGLFFPKIYTHEYKREWTMERERQQLAIRLNPASKLCDYHGEFTDDFCIEVYKKVKQDYARGKWKPSI